MPYRIEPFRRPLGVGSAASTGRPRPRAKDKRSAPPLHDPDEWLTWPDGSSAATELVSVDRPPVLLDAFTRLARPAEPMIRRSLLESFAGVFGPWAYCASHDLHADFDAPGLGPVPQSRELYLVRAERARRRQPMSPPRGAALAPPIQWIPGMFLSAVRVNALRAIVASAMQGRRADPRLWRLLWPATYRRPFALGSLESEAAAAYFIVRAWLAAEHVELGPPIGGAPDGTARVGGVAGALAVALANEFDTRNRVARCEHQLRGGRCGDLPIGDDPGVRAQRCGVTWRPGRRTKGGALPARCPACDNLHRVTELRVNRRRARQRS